MANSKGSRSTFPFGCWTRKRMFVIGLHLNLCCCRLATQRSKKFIQINSGISGDYQQQRTSTPRLYGPRTELKSAFCKSCWQQHFNKVTIELLLQRVNVMQSAVYRSVNTRSTAKVEEAEERRGEEKKTRKVLFMVMQIACSFLPVA